MLTYPIVSDCIDDLVEEEDDLEIEEETETTVV